MRLRGLRQVRQQQGISLSQLAELTGLRRESITRFEQGREEPQPYAIRRLAAVLHVSPDELIAPPGSIHRPSARDPVTSGM
jgi:transcriptional regulator with XRE-family HTH domain